MKLAAHSSPVFLRFKLAREMVEVPWVLKHRGTEEHRGKGLRMRGKMGDESKRPTNPIPASLGSLVAGVFRSPNFFPTQVMVRSEQWWRRIPADLSNQGGRCGSVVGWRVFTCRRSTGGRSGIRVERFHRVLILSLIHI